MISSPKLYQINHPRAKYIVVWKDPTRNKRIQKYFKNKKAAKAHLDKLNKELLFQGAAGLSFDATARADAIAARKTLDAAGLQMITLLELARERAESAAPPPNKCDILKTLRNFLDEKEEENRADRTISNLRNRITQWIEREGMLFVEDINRERCEALRARSGVSALTRRNDMAAASAFCSWLTDKKLLPHYPMRDLRKPRIDYKAPAILSPRQAKKLLNCALKRGNKQVLASLAIMLFSGPRPSEMPLAKIFYEDSPCVRLEGGKLRGRANRIVSIPPNALAWLERAGFPRAAREAFRPATANPLQADRHQMD